MNPILLTVMLGGGNPVRENLWLMPTGIGILGFFLISLAIVTEMVDKQRHLSEIHFSQSLVFSTVLSFAFVVLGLVIALITTAG